MLFFFSTLLFKSLILWRRPEDGQCIAWFLFFGLTRLSFPFWIWFYFDNDLFIGLRECFVLSKWAGGMFLLPALLQRRFIPSKVFVKHQKLRGGVHGLHGGGTGRSSEGGGEVRTPKRVLVGWEKPVKRSPAHSSQDFKMLTPREGNICSFLCCLPLALWQFLD